MDQAARERRRLQRAERTAERELARLQEGDEGVRSQSVVPAPPPSDSSSSRNNNGNGNGKDKKGKKPATSLDRPPAKLPQRPRRDDDPDNGQGRAGKQVSVR